YIFSSRRAGTHAVCQSSPSIAPLYPQPAFATCGHLFPNIELVVFSCQHLPTRVDSIWSGACRLSSTTGHAGALLEPAATSVTTISGLELRNFNEAEAELGEER